jgi:hypothetical protein
VKKIKRISGTKNFGFPGLKTMKEVTYEPTSRDLIVKTTDLIREINRVTIQITENIRKIREIIKNTNRGIGGQNDQ